MRERERETQHLPPVLQHTYLYIRELSVLRTHELSHCCWISGHLHGLSHQLRVMENVCQFRVTLSNKTVTVNFTSTEWAVFSDRKFIVCKLQSFYTGPYGLHKP